MSVRVALEIAPKRAFASAIDWPGWARGGRDEDEALRTLLAYAPRYAPVAARARLPFDSPAPADLDVVERIPGGTGTEFGVPAGRGTCDQETASPGELARLLRLLEAAWQAFDDAAESSAGVALRLGPRGGGRQVAKIVEHVAEAERAYLNNLGTKPPADAPEAGIRRAFIAAITSRAEGTPVESPNKVRNPWPPRYAIRRSAWHALDHAWEIEDRSS